MTASRLCSLGRMAGALLCWARLFAPQAGTELPSLLRLVAEQSN